MLRNRTVVCLSSIDWDFLWQGHQQIMATLARAGNRVVFVENTGVRRAAACQLAAHQHSMPWRGPWRHAC